MFSRKTTLTIIAALLFAAVLVASDTAGEQTLQIAIDLLESKRDLSHAIPMFEEVAKSPDHALAARGLFYLAETQQRLGIDNARATYERIVKQFGNQLEVAAEAQRRLASMSAVLPSDRPRYQQLSLTGVDSDGSLSSDGRWMAMIDWDSAGDVGVRDMMTGQVKRLMVKTSDATDDYGEWTMFSPRSDKVAYFWDPALKDADYQLRVTENKPGSKSDILFQLNSEITWIDSGVWFPDGKSLLLPIERGNTWELARIGISDHKFQILRSLEWRLQRSRPSISPDGKYVAYSALANNPRKVRQRGAVVVPPDSADQYIYVLPTDGSGAETIAARSSGVNDFPVWADNTHILFLSDRAVSATDHSGSLGLWSVEVQSGKPVGPSNPAMPGIGSIVPFGVTSSGSYYYAKNQNGEHVFTVGFDSGTGKVRGSSVRLTEDFTDFTCAPAWSPDSKSIAFERRHAPTQTTGLPSFELVVHAVGSENEKTYAIPNIRCSSAPIWLHDSKGLLLEANRASQRQILRLDLTSGNAISVESSTHSRLPAQWSSAALSPDDKTLYLASNDPKTKTASIVSYRLDSGEQKTVWVSPYPVDPNASGPRIALSHDGRTIAMIVNKRLNESHLIRVGTDGSGYRDLLPSTLLSSSALAWTRDNTILFVSPGSGQFQLMRMSADGGKPEFTGLVSSDGDRSIDLRPDGLRIAFSESTSSELWVVDNLSSLWRNAR